MRLEGPVIPDDVRGPARPLPLENGRATAPELPGHGVELDFDALAAHAP